MFKNYLKIALRNLLRNKGFTLINVSGLAIGLACCIIIVMFVWSETGYDSYHANGESIYRLTLDVEGLKSGSIWKSATSSILWGPALERDFPEVEDVVRVYEPRHEQTFEVDGTEFKEARVVAADETIFRHFNWPLLAGDPDAALREPYSVVVSERVARKLFGAADPVGRFIESEVDVAGGQNELVPVQYKVTGVMRNIPYKSHLKPEMILSFRTLNDWFGNDVTSGSHEQVWYWRGRIVHNYVVLKDGHDPTAFESKMPAVLDRYVGDATVSRGYEYHPYLQPIAGIHLEGDVNYTFEPGGDRTQLHLFSIIALFVLLIACINFMNLSTARSTKRAREVGIRKVVGAERKRLVTQFIGESVLVTLVSLGIALLLVEVINPIFYRYIGREFFLAPGTWFFLAPTLVLLALVVGVLAGSYPAFFLSAFRPSQVLKEQAAGGHRGAWLRKALVVVQFAITVFFIIGTLTVFKQLRFMRTQDLGFDSSQVVVLPPEVVEPLLPNVEALRNDLLQRPGVADVSVSWVVPGRTIGGDVWSEDGHSGEEGIGLNENAIDFDFVDLYGLEVIAGRSFSREMGADAAPVNPDSMGYEMAAIVNEAAVRAFGWKSPEDALGRRIVRDPVSRDFVGRIVGVVRDFHFESLHERISPMILYVNENWDRQNRYLSIAVDVASISEIVAFINERYDAVAGENPFSYFFIDQDFARQYEQEERLVEVYGYIAGLAIFIACLGLFGLAAFSAERRTKEVGVRKVLGAGVTRLIALLTLDFVKLVAVANLIAWPVAWFAMRAWLEQFAYRFEPGPGLFFLSGVLALTIAMMTVSFQAVRAALSNPVKALRYE